MKFIFNKLYFMIHTFKPEYTRTHFAFTNSSFLILSHPSSSFLILPSSQGLHPHPSSSFLILPHPSASLPHPSPSFPILPHPSPSFLILPHPSSSLPHPSSSLLQTFSTHLRLLFARRGGRKRKNGDGRM